MIAAPTLLTGSDISDVYGRTFKTLRISLTNTCNLACSYCVSENQKKPVIKTNGISTIQYIEIISVLNDILGLETVRLTGGEPTLYKDLIPLINGIKNCGIDHIKITTNGTLLESKAMQLKDAGITSVNISLDAYDPAVSLEITKRKNLKQVFKGIDSCVAAGIQTKINCVIMKGINDGEILKLFKFCKERNITIRFLELMQMGHLYHNFSQHYFSEAEILHLIAQEYSFQSLPREKNATAKYWITDDDFKFGIISNESDPFCNDCNRLRLDSFGNIYGCLSDNHSISLLDCYSDKDEVIRRLQTALYQKKTKFLGSELSMLHIGG